MSAMPVTGSRGVSPAHSAIRNPKSAIEMVNPSNHRVEAAGRSSSLTLDTLRLARRASASVRSRGESRVKPQASSLFACCLFFLAAAPALAATPILTDFSLTHSYTCGTRWFTLEGTDIDDGATVKLTRAGQPDIGAFAYQYKLQYGYVRGRFDLAEGTAGGLWSVVVTNPGGESATLTDWVEVVPDCPRGDTGDLYVCNSKLNNVLQFDGLTGDFVCIFAGATEWGEATELTRPAYLTWAPNGNLLVTSAVTGCGGLVIEYDGNTGQFLGYVVPPPCDQNRFQTSMTFGGPNGDLYIQTTVDSEDVIAQQYEPAPPWSFIQDSLRTAPPMISSYRARFASNGNLLVLGMSIGSPVPTFREYQHNAGSGEFELLREVVDVSAKKSVVESRDGCCYLLTETILGSRVDRYSVATFEYLDTLVDPPTCSPADPCFFEVMRFPRALAYGPNGNLFVSAQETAVPDPSPGSGYFIMGAIHVFDPVTGEQVDRFGQQDNGDTSIAPASDKLWGPRGIAFKPMPGDYASAGGAFNGDWQVDLNDFEKLTGVSPFTGQPVFTGPGIPCNDPHALLSFDQDRDGDLDLKDYAAFQRAFGTSLGD